MIKIMLTLIVASVLVGCIKDDFIADEVSAEIRIMNGIDTIAKDSTHQLTYTYFNNIGEVEEVVAQWSSEDNNIATVTNEGLFTGINFGSTTISVEYNGIKTSKSIVVDTISSQVTTQKSGRIVTTSSYVLEGDFTIDQITPTSVRINIASNYRASTALPGLFVYLSNNPNTTANALEIGPVTVFNGVHSYTVNNVTINDYGHLLYFCKPFNVKVGSGAIN